MKITNPKKLAIGYWILSRILSENGHRSLVGDFEEMYSEIVREEGVLRALLWYWMQIIRTLPSYILNTFYWRIDMFKNYMKIALRSIKKHKGFSFINIAGLAVGMACCILILLWIRDELSYERFHVNAENIYRVLSSSQNPDGSLSVGDGTPGLLGPTLEAEYPEIEKAVRTVPQLRCPLKVNDKKFYAECVATESSFFEIFTVPLINGETESALESPGSIVLTEETAIKFFGDEDPLGQTINLNFWHSFDLQVTGVIKDVPQNSHIKFDCLIHFSVLRSVGWDIDAWGGTNNKSYVLLKKDLDFKNVEEKIAGIYQQHYPDRQSTVRLEPITRIHLFNYNGGGAIVYVYIFSTLGIIILLIACINFTNLSTARSSIRAKEVGLRKVVGANIPQLRAQFLGESLLLSLLALIIAVFLSRIFLPAFNDLAGKSLTMNFTALTMIHFFIIALLTGIISGFYPALYLSAFQPHKIIKGTSSSGKKTPLIRKGLVVFQFTVSIFLIITAITLYSQLNFIQDRDLGFEKDQVLVLQTSSDLKNNYEVLKQELLKNPEILTMTMINGSFVGRNSSSSDMRWEGMPENREVKMLIHSVDFDYMNTFDLEMAQGRFFSEELSTDAREGVVLNEAAVQALGIADPIGKTFYCPTPAGDVDGRIIGVVKNYHVSSLHEDISPMVLVIVPDWYTSFYIRMNSDHISRTLSFIEKKTQEIVPEYVFEYHFLDERIDNLYRTEMRQGQISRILTIVSIFISCLGLFGLVSFTTERRTKEIGVRKVLGASVPGIVTILSKEFVKWVLVANIIAWPIAYFTMNRWLQDFAYKTRLTIWTFIFSALFVLLIALLTVSYQSIKAARSNPVDALKYE